MAKRSSRNEQEQAQASKRLKRCAFVDDCAAEVSEEEDEEVELEELVSSPAPRRPRPRPTPVPALRPRSIPAFFNSDKEIDENYFNQRYGKAAAAASASRGDDIDNSASEEDDDAYGEECSRDAEKWWMVKCRPEAQTTVVKRLQSRVLKTLKPRLLEGFVYVQSRASCYVMSQAISGLGTVKMVAASEVRQVMKMKKPKPVEDSPQKTKRGSCFLGERVVVGDYVKSAAGCGTVVQVLKDSVVVLVSNEREIKVAKNLVQKQDMAPAAPAAPAASTEQQSRKKAFHPDSTGARRNKQAAGRRIVRIKRGPLKGSKGRVLGINLGLLRVELEAQMRVVQVAQSDVSDWKEPPPVASTSSSSSKISLVRQHPICAFRSSSSSSCPTPMRDVPVVRVM